MSISVENKKGGFTLPAQSGYEKEVKLLAEKWGADAFRDSDGTALSQEILEMGFDIYSTLCMIRADQDWPKRYPHQCQQKFLMSDPITAKDEMVTINLLKGYSHEQFKIDTVHDEKKYWEVFDRTTGTLVDTWVLDKDSGTVTITQAHQWHVYTVNFLVFQIWETTSMYNYITNNWTGEHQMGINPYLPETRAHLLEFLDSWLDNHPNTDIVRFTAIAYQFPIITNEERKTRYQDWCGYHDCMSVEALNQFEKVKGYRLRSEHLINKGSFNDINQVPSTEYLDWIDFVNEFTTDFAAEWVDRVHKKNRKAMMFFCDHWIGTEPYNETRFAKMKFDSLVNPVINGSELRRMSDVPGDYLKEVRLYPYFFPVNLKGEPLFKEGGDPVGECKRYWMQIRRAMLRKGVDRIGFGGYLELAIQHTAFLDYVAQLSDEFRSIRDNAQKSEPHSLLTVAILDAWGVRRSWMHKEDWPVGGITESLSGLPVNVRFMSFSDIRTNGIPDDVDVILNKGVAGTSWSGGENWADPHIVSVLREWVNNGGGLLGYDEPTAYDHQGRFFQLADVLGVERERGLTKCNRKPIKGVPASDHFIVADYDGDLVVGNVTPGVYTVCPETLVLRTQHGSCALTAHAYGAGRSVYLGGFSFTANNTRLLHRALAWAASKEDSFAVWSTSNINTECAYYPEKKMLAAINNSDVQQKTVITDATGGRIEITLEPAAMVWLTR
jgi:1,3-beta-galactosyl-N-acetylhexosamine phosphorylase